MTTLTVAVALVLAATSLTYGMAYAASGSAYAVRFTVLGASVMLAAAPSLPYSWQNEPVSVSFQIGRAHV
jgi:hypothetical protein